MSLSEFKPVPIPKLGGLMTFLKPVDVPSGYSPNLQNVRFLPRAVLTRSGLTSRFLKNGASFNGVEQFIDNLKNKTLVSLDSAGNLDFQDPVGLVNPISLQKNVATPGSFLTSKNAFGSIFLSFFNQDLSPAGPVRRWNGIQNTVTQALTNFTAVDSATAGAWAAATYPITIFFQLSDGSILQASNTINWVTAGGKKLQLSALPTGGAGLKVIGRWVCVNQPGLTIPYRFPTMYIADNVSTTATFDSPGSNFLQVGAPMDELASNAVNFPPLYHLAPDGPGSAPVAADSSNAGSVAVGVHTVWVVFETVFGYLTQPSPSTTWTAAGGKKALISSIPIGPWYVTARRILFSSSGGADLFYLSTFRIPDNTSQAVEVDFNDTSLLLGSNVDYLTRNVMMSPAIGVTAYGSRLATWGGINNIRAAGLNLGFDGGFSQSTGAPLGWSLDGGFGAGGIREVFNAYAGDAWRFTGDGATVNRGMILNAGIQSLLAANTPYSVSFRARCDAGIFVGNVNAELFSPTLGSLGLVTVSHVAMGQGWGEFTGQLTIGLASIPSDLVLRVYAGATLDNGKRIWIDHLLIYQTNAKFEPSVLRISNPFDVETFDSVNGFQQLAKDNGQAIVGVVQLRAFLYVLKERSFHVTWDDSINPPALWVNRQIDSTIGLGSPRGLISSDTFIAFSFRSGAYVFTGAKPLKVSQEIQTSWAKIKWSASGASHTVLDPQSKLILFFVPYNGATVKNAFVLDYSEGMGQEDDPGPRKWGLDVYPFPINGSLRFETSDTDHPGASNQQVLYFAGSKIYENTGTDDDGVAIDSFYETAFMNDGEGQMLFGGVGFYTEGSGQLLITAIGLDDIQQQSLQAPTLTIQPGFRIEEFANLESEKARIRFESNIDNTNFIIKGVIMYFKRWAEQRPH